jgi:Sec-independent protein secretion pathway component TatC
LSFLLSAGDLVAATLLCLPLFALYEAGILIIRFFTKKPENDDTLSNDLDGSV